MPTSGAPIGSPLGQAEAAAAAAAPDGPSTYSRYINPGTKSFEVDPATNHLAQMPGVRQRVLIVLSSIRGSSTVLPQLGIRIGGSIDARIERRLQGEVRAGLQSIVDEKAMRIERITIDTGSLDVVGKLTLTVQYTDLTQGLRNQQQTVLL